MDRFVRPQVVRLYLADVHRRNHEALLALGTKATPAQITESAAQVRAAEALGDYIDVKRRLTTGEEQALMKKMAPHVTPGEKPQLDSEQVLTAKVAAYLLGWSFTDLNGSPAPVSDDAIAQLDPDTFREVRLAIDAHEAMVQAEVEAARKNLSGSPEQSRSLPSVEP